MKKQFLMFAALICLGSAAMAQSKAYGEGDNLLNVGVGLGSPFFSTGYSSSGVNPSASFEHGLSNAISIGAQASYASVNYNFSGYTVKETATYIGARGSYHLNEALSLPSSFDLYGGVSLGYVIASVNDNAGNSFTASSALGFGVFAGGKYYFSQGVGIYAEAGYQSLALLNVGLAFKF